MSELDPNQARGPGSVPGARPQPPAAALEPLRYVQDNLAVVRRVLDRLGGLLPPQICEDDLAAQLVLKLVEHAAAETPAAALEEGLWREALACLRDHPLMQAAARWLDQPPDEDDSPEALREAALALTVFADRWLPDETSEDEELLAWALSRLGTYERLAMALFFYDGLTLPEIGEVLDLPPDEVAALYGLALRQLRWNLALAALERKAA